MRYKALFILLSALLGVGIHYWRFLDASRVGLQLRIPNYSQLVYNPGEVYLEVLLPMGAILYWIFKKRLMNGALKRDALRDKARGVESDVLEIPLELRGLGGKQWQGKIYAVKGQMLGQFLEKRLLPYASHRQKANWQICLSGEPGAEAIASIIHRPRKARLRGEDQTLEQFFAGRDSGALYLMATDELD